MSCKGADNKQLSLCQSLDYGGAGRAESNTEMNNTAPAQEIKKENQKTKYACYIPSYLLDKPRTKYELLAALTLHNRPITAKDIRDIRKKVKPERQRIGNHWFNNFWQKVEQARETLSKEPKPEKTKPVQFNYKEIIEIIVTSKKPADLFIILRLLMHTKGIMLKTLANLAQITTKQTLRILRNNKFFGVIRTEGEHSNDIIKISTAHIGLMDIRKDVKALKAIESTKKARAARAAKAAGKTQSPAPAPASQDEMLAKVREKNNTRIIEPLPAGSRGFTGPLGAELSPAQQTRVETAPKEELTAAEVLLLKEYFISIKRTDPEKQSEAIARAIKNNTIKSLLAAARTWKAQQTPETTENEQTAPARAELSPAQETAENEPIASAETPQTEPPADDGKATTYILHSTKKINLTLPPLTYPELPGENLEQYYNRHYTPDNDSTNHPTAIWEVFQKPIRELTAAVNEWQEKWTPGKPYRIVLDDYFKKWPDAKNSSFNLAAEAALMGIDWPEYCQQKIAEQTANNW